MLNYDRLSRTELISLLESSHAPIHDTTLSIKGASTRSHDELNELLQNLQLYQVRLEMQNRELREAQQELQETQSRLSDLYDFAPVGYVTLDERGCIHQINLTGSTMLQMERTALIEKPFVRFVMKDDVRTFILHLRRCLESEENVSSELRLALPDKSTVHVHLSSVRVADARRATFLYRTAMTNITELKTAERKVQDSLREKEVLLKEVHHRVKNNLQTISSLLKLQSGFVTDKRALELFRESQNIVRSLALIHEKLYRSTDLSHVNYAEYLNTIATNLFRSFGVNSETVALRLNVENVSWGLDTAIPVSLIINELLSNSLKYAFPNGRAGEISIDLHSNKHSQFTLVVADNGVGIPAHIELNQTDSLGLQLVHALTDELDGTLRIERNSGTRFTITFAIQPQVK